MRTPRPMGTTELARHLQSSTQNTEHYNEQRNNLYEHVIRHYINTNFMYCNKSINIETFSHYIQVEPTLIHNMIIHIGQLQYKLHKDKDKEDLFGGLIFYALNGALSDRSSALQHASILLNAQGQTYKPFISAEVTRALKLNQEANAQVLNVLSKFVGTQGPIININNKQNNVNHNAPTLTVEDALILINKQGSVPLLEDTNAKEDLFLEYGLSDMPEVNATKQTGYDTSKEGLNFKVIADANLEEGPNDSEHHNIRREKEYNIDLEADEV